MADFLVFAPIADGAAHDVSLQALARARALADASGGRVTVLAAGAGLGAAPAGLPALGADTVLVADHPALATYLTAPYLKVLRRAVETAGPFAAVLLPATTAGNDLAPVLAGVLDAPCVVDCVDLCLDGGGRAVGRRLEFDRKVFADYAAANDRPAVLTLVDGVAPTPAPDPARAGATRALDLPADLDAGGARVLRRDVAARSVNLKDARVIVAAGAGVGSAERFGLVRQLAGRLGAELGATRAVVDAGWLPADHQIGQTGATVRPDLYIALGVSGAVQHRVGMMDSRKIVAVNTDKAAPIFKIAHYRIAGDLGAVVPKLLKALG